MLVLFFDTYIVSGIGSKSGIYVSNYVEKKLSEVRDRYETYTWKEKIDVVKYTLISYSKIKWDKVVIRFECEDKSETKEFANFCKEYFPDALVETTRSDTAKKYFDALKKLNLPPRSWVFFSPNNDHPYIQHPKYLTKLIDYAEGVQKKLPEKEIGILFSHKLESTLDNKMTQPLWGYFNNKFKKIIFEDDLAYVTSSNVIPLDSIQILRYEYLLYLFSNTKNKNRVIRLEDLEFNWSRNKDFIQISPKKELCRHYDGYTNLMQYVPPLFIPNGFFKKDIKVRYGYDDRIISYTNLNPNYSNISDNVDLPIFLPDIPYFWLDRINVLDKNPFFKEKYTKNTSPFYLNMINPWRKRVAFINIARSLYLLYIRYNKYRISTIIRGVLRETPIYPLLRKIRSKIVNEKYN